jgi:isoleucyl-tRNA synthetase
MVAAKGRLTVALDVTVTPELEQEGHARELVNRIQKIRKDQGYELTDKVLVKVSATPELVESFTRFNTYICAEILAEDLGFEQDLPQGIEKSLMLWP